LPLLVRDTNHSQCEGSEPPLAHT